MFESLEQLDFSEGRDGKLLKTTQTLEFSIKKSSNNDNPFSFILDFQALYGTFFVRSSVFPLGDDSVSAAAQRSHDFVIIDIVHLHIDLIVDDVLQEVVNSIIHIFRDSLIEIIEHRYKREKKREIVFTVLLI